MTGRLLDMALVAVAFGGVPAFDLIAARLRGRDGAASQSDSAGEERPDSAGSISRPRSLAAPLSPPPAHGLAQQSQEGPVSASPSRVHGRPSRPQPTSR